MGFNLLTAIKNVAPMIAGTFGTPLAGLAVNALVSVLPDEHKGEVQQAMAAGGDAGAMSKLGDMFQQGVLNIAQVKQAELAHAERMAEMGYKNEADLANIAAQDTANARAREMALRDHTPAVLAGVIVCGAIIVSIAIVSGNAPAMKDPTIAAIGGSIVGYIFGEVKQVYTYYFGSTASNKSKDATIAEIAKAP